jgi:hypothetical protein
MTNGSGDRIEVHAESKLHRQQTGGAAMSHDDHDGSKYHVKITVDKDDDHTRANARMRWRHVELVGVGDADLDPDDQYPRRVGEELAVARALTHLTRQLFVATAGDIESVTGEDVSVR